MRTAILTDIHANLPALESVLRECESLRVDRFVCLGDTVGYGAEPNECCDIIRSKVSFSLLGNHDAAVAGRMDYEYYYEAARHALDWTRRRLSPPNLAWLTSLPYKVREGPVEFCHGAPLEPEQYEYIFLLEQAAELLPVLEDLADVTLIGHSHLPRVYELSEDEAVALPTERIDFRPGRKYVVSIGSVGQPRDGDARACFGILDTDANAVEFYRSSYDIDRTAERIIDAGLSTHFARRLYNGV